MVFRAGVGIRRDDMGKRALYFNFILFNFILSFLKRKGKRNRKGERAPPKPQVGRPWLATLRMYFTTFSPFLLVNLVFSISPIHADREVR